MIARDIMTTDVVTVSPDTRIEKIATLLWERHISGVPVTDEEGRIVGIVSEADLMHWGEPTPQRSWWLTLFADVEALASRFVKTHGSTAKDVMTSPVVTVTEDMPVTNIARLREERRIKRVPVVRDGYVVGIVSRADLVRGLAARGLNPPRHEAQNDGAIRDQLLATLKGEPWATDLPSLSIVVDHGVVHLWGIVRSEEVREALRVAAEGVVGVLAVEDHLFLWRRLRPAG